MNNASSSSIISFQNVSKVFRDRKKEIVAVDDVTFSIERGEIFGIIGYSGAGKSTLVRLINQLEEITIGEITVLDQNVGHLKERDLKELRTHIGMIFQQFNLFNAKTVRKNVEFPLKLAKWDKEKRRARAQELLEFVGIADRADHYPAELSGGQKQRAGIARALASNPQILLADEATSALDPDTTIEVLKLLKRVNKEFGVTIVVITHAMNVAKYICDKIAVMEDGKVVEIGTVSDIFTNPKAPITKRFVATASEVNDASIVLENLLENHPELQTEAQKAFENARNIENNEQAKISSEGINE